MPVLTQDLTTFIAQFDGPVYGTALENAVAYKEVSTSDSFALLLGNEGEGVNPELLAHTTQNLIIPIYGKAESLNVAIAGSILLYHLKGWPSWKFSDIIVSNCLTELFNVIAYTIEYKPIKGMDIYINNCFRENDRDCKLFLLFKIFSPFGYLKRFKSERQSVINIKQVYA